VLGSCRSCIKLIVSVAALNSEVLRTCLLLYGDHRYFYYTTSLLMIFSLHFLGCFFLLFFFFCVCVFCAVLYTTTDVNVGFYCRTVLLSYDVDEPS
jgi:hypothetical protein